MGRRGGAGARRGERAREGAANLFRKKESKWRFCGCAKFINSALTSPPPRLPGGERWARLGTPPRRAPRAPPPPARPRAAPRTLIRRHITCRSDSSPGDALPRQQQQPVANSISNSPSSRGGRGASKERSEHNFPPPPFLRPSLLRPAAQQRDARGSAGGARGGGQVPRGAPRPPAAPAAAPAGLSRARPRSRPGVRVPRRPAALPERGRSASGAAGGGAAPPPALRNSPLPWKCLCILRRLPARCLTRYSGRRQRPAAPRAGVSFCLGLFPQKLFVLARFGSPQGSVVRADLKGHVQFNGTADISAGTGGANAVSNQRRDAAACTYRWLHCTAPSFPSLSLQWEFKGVGDSTSDGEVFGVVRISR
ncbi:uncharacterized protein [Sylvia atricapilla]|uniref:uncharacterized protein n=1 Tax=Sylvia atricapilla TaxID=48155 RepID=UPI003396D2C6